MHCNRSGTSFMANKRNICSIAIERGNILVNELHSKTLVMQTEITRRRLGLGAEETEWSKTIVNRNHDDTSLSQNESIIELRRSAAEATTVDEYHHWVANIQTISSLY
jgi:hypothetical protein